MTNCTAIGIDLAKRTFQVCELDTRSHQEISNRAVKRRELLKIMSQHPPCRVFMEVCGGAHYWSRQFRAMGHEVKLIPPQFVVPYRQGHKTDRNDAYAIVEAGLRPKMKFSPSKNLTQQDIQSQHRVRDRLQKQRIQLINQTHGLLQEYGIASGRGERALRRCIHESIEDAENELTPVIRDLLMEQLEELSEIEKRLARMDKRIACHAHQHEGCRALLSLEGVGPVVSTLLYCALGQGEAFRRGREASAYLGLTPKQKSTGDRVILTGIGKTGHPQLKAALIRGAHSVLQTINTKQDPKSRWLQQLVARSGKNKAAVALANKTVRHAWAILRLGDDYCPHSPSPVAG